MLIISYLAYKNFKEKGCEFISKIQWPNLQRLTLSKNISDKVANDINDKGCEHLASTNWP